MDKLPGLYIHIPFCRGKCPYCDFYSIKYEGELAGEYVSSLRGELSSRVTGRVESVYMGGGTPTVLSLPLLKDILKKISPLLGPGTEFTVEANPESLSPDKLKLFLDYGVNRISIGVQSLSPDKLRFLGRVHSVEQAREAVLSAYRRGFSNISADLIYGLPGERLSNWREELKRAVELPLSHLSVYSLTCEENTLFFKFRNKIPEGPVAGMFSFNIEYLPSIGFSHYEVSNFSRPGRECAHNCIYWDNREYVGIGASAVSFMGRERSKNVSSVEEYVYRQGGGVDLRAEKEKLSDLAWAGETAALNIRRGRGLVFSEFLRRTGYDFPRVVDKNLVDRFIERGLVRLEEDDKGDKTLSLTPRGFLFADEICSGFV